VAGKTFRLVFGEWIDADFDGSALLPEVSVSTPEERSALLARIPALVPYAALGERVLVVHDGTVYRFQLDPSL
jgi:Ca-activated chloride channel family protein